MVSELVVGGSERATNGGADQKELSVNECQPPGHWRSGAVL
jgi:hypothetical protein